MKKIMLILIPVVMLFTSCEKSSPQQIDPFEEFGGITFGMTQDEVVSILGKKPYKSYEPDDINSDYNYIMYHDEEHFNVSTTVTTYCFTRDDGALRRILYEFSWDESDQKQFINGYEVIYEEIIRRYPKEICTYFFYDETDLTIYTENRSIFLQTGNSLIRIFVDEYLPGIYDTRSDAEESETTEEAAQTQIDPIEEFGGITFGMTKDEVIEFHGRQPDHIFDDDNIFITYKNETYFNISNAEATYYFDENGNLHNIHIMYLYSKDSEDNSFQADYESIKDELLIRYPKRDEKFTHEEEDRLDYFSYNRSVTLSRFDNAFYYSIYVAILNTEK